MKTNKLVSCLAIIGFSSVFLFTSCKKKEDPKPEEEVVTPQPDENGQSSADSKDAQSENDVATNDINDVMSNNSKMSGRGTGNTEAQGVTGPICGLIVDSVDASNGILKLTYDSTTCLNRTRTGSIRLTLQNYASGTRWKDANAVIKVEYLGYKITRASDQKSLTFNGTQFLTNVSGGNWLNLIWWKDKASLITTVTGTNLKVTWQDNKTATYNINRRITYTYPLVNSTHILTVKCEGIGSSGALNDLENYGTTRDGDFFTSQVTTPIMWNLTCGPWAPVQGALNVQVASKNFGFKISYAVDVNGNPVTVLANQCAYGWKLEWTYNGKTNSNVFGYF